MIRAPWHTLLAISALYLVLLPVSFAGYARVKQRRATRAVPATESERVHAG